MHSRLSDAAFELDGVFEHVLDQLSAVFIFVLELGQVFHAVGEFRLEFLLDLLPVLHHLGFKRLVRDHLGEPVGLVDRHVAHACDILYGAFRRHGPERYHVGHMVFPVCVLHIPEYPVPSVIVEVNVYIRHGDTVRVEETLKQELVFDRVYIGDSQTVGYGGSCRGATSRAY